MGHFARFVPPDSVRLATTLQGAGTWPQTAAPWLEAVSFLTPSEELVVVVLNRGNEDAAVKLTVDAGQSAKVEVPAHAFVTLLAQGILAV